METQRGNRSYLAVAFGLLVFVAVVYGGASWFTHRMPRQHPAASASVVLATPIVDASPVPADVPITPIPTLDPQPFPTPIIDGPTPTSGQPVPWEVTKMIDTQFNRPYWMAQSDVVVQVRQNYQQMDAFYRAHTFDLDPADERQFYAEPLLDIVMSADREDQERGEARGRAILVRPNLQILGFRADGRAVQVAQEVHGELIPVYDRATHRLIHEESSPVGAAISTLVYDSTDRRWKINESTFVPGPPGIR